MVGVRVQRPALVDLMARRAALQVEPTDEPPLVDQICARLGPNEAPVVDAFGRCVGVARRFGGMWVES